MSKGKETRQRIVAEAAALFNQRGFQGASLAALMQATGLEKGGIYRHFESKEALAAEAFDFAWRAAADDRTLELDAIPHSVDKLKQFVANFVERRSPIPGGCPLLNSAVDSDDGNSVLRERAAGARPAAAGEAEAPPRAGTRAPDPRRSDRERPLLSGKSGTRKSGGRFFATIPRFQKS